MLGQPYRFSFKNPAGILIGGLVTGLVTVPGGLVTGLVTVPEPDIIRKGKTLLEDVYTRSFTQFVN